jgi:CHAT domain-containing protein/tetratricopeptide (TPR) repeat protein
MSRKTILVLVAVPAVLCGVAISRVFGADARLEPLQEMARMRPARAFAARISIPTAYHDCTPTPPPAGDSLRTVTTETCGKSGVGDLDLPDLAGVDQSTDPDSLQASALAAMIWPDDMKLEALDDAIARLERAERLSRRSAPLLVDLSAAHLLRAERRHYPRDFLAAIHHARGALALEPRNVSALFNYALALQAFGLDEAADRAWEEYLAVDSTSPWAVEARRRKDTLITSAAEIPYPGLEASEPAVVEFARQYPQEAREYGWNQVLGTWGGAAAGGDSANAASHLKLAERLGHALELRPGGDRSLADAVRAIRQVQAERESIRVLGRAHQAFALGQQHFQTGDFPEAREAFERVVRARPPSNVLLQWNTLFLRIVQGRTGELPTLLAQVDSSRQPALTARARMLLGRRLTVGGKYDSARVQLHSADLLFRSAGETEWNAAVWSLEGERAYQHGDTLRAYRFFHRAHQGLRQYRQSVRLRNHLSGLARSVLLDRMPRAALPVFDEDVYVTERTGVPLARVDALQARARALSVMGDRRGADRDLDSAVALYEQVPEERLREWARAIIRIAGPDTLSAAARDSAVDVLAQNALWMVPALQWRARLHVQAGDLEAATRDVERMILGTLDALRSAKSWERGAILEQAGSSFDTLVMLNLRRGRPADALRALERGRLSFGPWRGAATTTATSRLAAPPGHVALDYTMIGNALLTWTIRADTLRFLLQPVNRDTFMLTVAQVNAALEMPERDAAAQAGLRKLYDWLIRPVRGSLGPAETPLIIVADGEVAGVPFAALADSSTGRYLVQDYSLRYAPTLADAARPARRRDGDGLALLVADPKFQTSWYPGLYALGGTRAELDSLLPLFPHYVRLQDSTATRNAFLRHAQSASIIHYAGHAVFDDARPERSYLLLAGADTTGRLTAEAVSEMRLGGVRLVVLSACRTLPSREGRSGGFAGLSGALLAAGAGGVVGSLWQVNDQLTAPLMGEFHRAYRDSADPAQALRAAQLAMLAKGDSLQSSPAAWAGFRYTGAERP